MDDPSRDGLTLQARNARPNGTSARRVLKHGSTFLGGQVIVS